MRCNPVFVVVALLSVASVAQAQDQRIVAFCDKLEECGLETEADLCVSNAVASDTAARGVGNEVCTDYAEAELVWMDCISSLQCSNLNDCAEEDGPRDDLEEQGATACGNGAAPQPPPGGWTCDPGVYNAADGCDCGCGVEDPDCEGGCVAASCDAEGCRFCHDNDTDLFTCGGTPDNDGNDGTGGNGGFGGSGGGGDDGGSSDGGGFGEGTCSSTGAALSPVVGVLFAALALRRRRR